MRGNLRSNSKWPGFACVKWEGRASFDERRLYETTRTTSPLAAVVDDDDADVDIMAVAKNEEEEVVAVVGPWRR